MAEKRRPFKLHEQEQMLKYWEKMLKENNEGAFSPCGNLLWEKYVSEGHSTRTPVNLSSHFRKQIIRDFWEWWDVPPTRLMNLFRMWDPEFTEEMKSGVERKLRVKITLKSSKKMKDWKPRATDEKEIKKEETVEAKRRVSDGDKRVDVKRNRRSEDVLKSNLPRRSMPNFNDGSTQKNKEGSKKSEEIESPGVGSLKSGKSLRSRAKRIESAESMPDPNEHNYTREIVDTKKQARVRHSTREALGLPPILTPPKHVEAHLPFQVIADASFHEDAENQDENPLNNVVEISSGADAMMGNTILISPKSNGYFEGQGNNIDTFDGAHASPSTLRVSPEEFREEAIREAFSSLQEKFSWIGEANLNVLRIRERELYEKLLFEKGPEMFLGDYMEEYLEAIGKLVENFTDLSDVTLGLRSGESSVDENTRSHVISLMMRDFIEKVSSRYIELISEMIEEKEPYIYFGAANDLEYTEEMRKLSECIWEKIKFF